MNAFALPTPHHPLPLPPLPVLNERRGAPMLSPISDIFSTTTTPTSPTTPTTTRHGTRKPLPLLQRTEETDNPTTVVVKKPRALPKIPISPSATTQRSLSVRDADDKVTASPAPAVADVVAGDHKPKENAAGWEDNSLHGLLDVFKGELSTLDPVSPASLDLRDPSTPTRKLFYQSQANDLVLSAHEIQGGGVGGERDEGVRSPPISVPATPSRSVEQEDKSAPAAIIPPRSSSLQSPVYSIGSGSHATSSRQASYQLSPLRLRTGPAAAVTPGKHLRAVHRSSASSSEPSLIPTSDESRVCEQHSLFHTSFAEPKPK
jgi:PH/SEC7 domain-containing protein